MLAVMKTFVVPHAHAQPTTAAAAGHRD